MIHHHTKTVFLLSLFALMHLVQLRVDPVHPQCFDYFPNENTKVGAIQNKGDGT
jgi:hypothetical protein